MTTHTATRSYVQLDAPVQVQRQDSHNCWMRRPERRGLPIPVPARVSPRRAGGRRPGRLHPGRSHGARACPSIGTLDVHLSGAVLKRELISSWTWQVKICYAYCKGLKTNACANCNPVRFNEPRGKSSHTVARAPFVVSIVFPRLWKMLTTCDILSNSKRNWNLPLLRGGEMEISGIQILK